MASLDQALPIAVIVLADPNVQHRLADLGITNLSLMVPVPQFFGYDGDHLEFQGRLIAQVYLYMRRFPNDNFYDLPIHTNFDPTNRTGDFVPLKLHNYDPEVLPLQFFRDDVNRIRTTQPNGPSFVLNGNFLQWQKFQLRVGFNGRESLILHHTSYNDNGKVRPLIYRAALSELFISYADPRPPFHRLMGFDVGQYGLSQRANDLKSLRVCGTSSPVRYLDAYVHNLAGEPFVIKNAICIHEEDAGLLWMKSDPSSGRAVSVRSQRLVIHFLSTMENYEYQFRWIFHQDASIKVEAKLTGIVHNTFVATGSTPGKHGTLVAPNINGLYHQHLFVMRIDTEIDGNKNSVSVMDVLPDKGAAGSPHNPYGNGFLTTQTVLKTAGEARSRASAETGRTWLIFGDSHSNPNSVSGTPKGWKLISDSTPPLMLRKDSLLYPKCAFADYNVWITRYQENQLYAGGMYLNNSGLAEWVGQNEGMNVRNTDIVLWHVFGSNHIPRVEDFPVMPVETVGFWLKPWNFFIQNPALCMFLCFRN